MQLKYRLPLAIFATTVFAACCLHAQEDDDDEEEFGSMGFYSRSPQAVNVALNLTQGPKVKFGNLGSVALVVDNSNGAVTGRVYMDGNVSTDFLRPYSSGDRAEIGQTGDPSARLYPNGTRYQTYLPGGATQIGDYVSYNNKVTRNWQYYNPSQALSKPGYIAFDDYSARSQGASMTANRGYTGGVELAIARSFTNPAKRVSLSMVASLTLTGINSTKSGQVDSTLHTVTDYYLYHPTQYSPAGAPALSTPGTDANTGATITYSGPSFDTTIKPGVNTETTTTLSANPDITGDPNDNSGDVVDGAKVTGRWKLKGAYFTLKVGPQINAMVTRSLGLTAGVGVAGSFVGTTYTADESFVAPEPISLKSITVDESSTRNLLLAGYYASVDATWTLNERAGFFAGFSYDNLGDYNQSVGGRTAKIDLSGNAGVRGGFSIKF